MENNLELKNKPANGGKWYMTVIGGLIGLILGVIPIAACILLLDQLYFICLLFTPILACLFIRILGGGRNIYSIIYAAVLSLIATLIAGYMLEAGSIITTYNLPKYEIARLTVIMIANSAEYIGDVWSDLTGDIFNAIFIIAYLAIGLLFSWEFIFKKNTKQTVEGSGADTALNSDVDTVSEKDSAASEGDDTGDEYEYVYEDELEADENSDEIK